VYLESYFPRLYASLSYASAYQFDKGREHSTQVCGSAFRLIVLARRDDPGIGYFQSLLGTRKRHCAMPDQTRPYQHCFGPHDSEMDRVWRIKRNELPLIRTDYPPPMKKKE